MPSISCSLCEQTMHVKNAMLPLRNDTACLQFHVAFVSRLCMFRMLCCFCEKTEHAYNVMLPL